MEERSCVIAAVDIGTVTSRLIVAIMGADGSVRQLARKSQITDLGQGVDASGFLAPEALERTLSCVRAYREEIDQVAQDAGVQVDGMIATCTSAARDASNADELLGGMAALGLPAQVIPGEVEARLSLLGVTGDFEGQPVLVADIGGGSTELSRGLRARGAALQVGRSHSFDVGCRRVTDRFFAGADVPDAAAVDAARAFVRDELGVFFGQTAFDAGEANDETLVCVGGTATSLVAIDNRLVPYDSSFVHLHRTARSRVSDLAARLLAMPLEQRRQLPGLQPKRAGVIAAGAVILDELMGLGGFDEYVASESDSFYGLLACAHAALEGRPGPLEPLWSCDVTRL